ncbi:MAG: PAS domain-containing protein [Bacteroidales bacterium]|nr:PAS domain-containing protein [Bacteroidales bacterium]
MVEDISRRKNIEERLLLERNQLRTLIDNIPDFVYVKDNHHRFTMANQSLARLIKASHPNDLIGKTDSAYFPESVQHLFRKDEESIFKTGQPIINKEEKIYTAESTVVKTAYTSKIPLKDAHNNIIGIVGIGRDITDLKNAEEMVKSAQANLNAVLESSTNAIWSINEKLKLTSANKMARRFFKNVYGITMRVGSSVYNITPREDFRFWKSIYHKGLTGKQWREEHPFLIEGQPGIFEISVNPITDSPGRIKGVTVFLDNVTQRKIAVEALRASEEKFRQLAESINDSSLSGTAKRCCTPTRHSRPYLATPSTMPRLP